MTFTVRYHIINWEILQKLWGKQRSILIAIPPLAYMEASELRQGKGVDLSFHLFLLPSPPTSCPQNISLAPPFSPCTDGLIPACFYNGQGRGITIGQLLTTKAYQIIQGYFWGKFRLQLATLLPHPANQFVFINIYMEDIEFGVKYYHVDMMTWCSLGAVA